MSNKAKRCKNGNYKNNVGFHIASVVFNRPLESIYQNSAWQRGWEDTNKGKWTTMITSFFCPLGLTIKLNLDIIESGPLEINLLWHKSVPRWNSTSEAAPTNRSVPAMLCNLRLVFTAIISLLLYTFRRLWAIWGALRSLEQNWKKKLIRLKATSGEDVTVKTHINRNLKEKTITYIFTVRTKTFILRKETGSSLI